MEKLQSYLAGKPKAAFAREVGIAPAYLSQLLAGTKTPSLSLMYRIEQVTGGAVTRMHWFPQTASSEGV